jgi:hypothetical protein
MTMRLVLSAMRAANHCSRTGVSIPECSCRECCRSLLAIYAPALLDLGPLEQPCAIPPAIETVEQHAERRGISVAHLHRRAAQLEVKV